VVLFEDKCALIDSQMDTI